MNTEQIDGLLKEARTLIEDSRADLSLAQVAWRQPGKQSAALNFEVEGFEKIKRAHVLLELVVKSGISH